MGDGAPSYVTSMLNAAKVVSLLRADTKRFVQDKFVFNVKQTLLIAGTSSIQKLWFSMI